MPKFTPFKMTDADYDKLKAVAAGSNLGGLCVAISLKWLERIYQNQPLPASFAEEDLDALAQQQVTYNDLALKTRGPLVEQGFIDYCKKREFTVTKIKGGNCDHGQIDELEEIVLEPNTGYMLSFSDTDIGSPKAHVIALYRPASDGPLQIRDQNIGQMEVSNEAKLHEEYNEVIKGHHDEYEDQRERERADHTKKVTIPDYKKWTLYKVTR